MILVLNIAHGERAVVGWQPGIGEEDDSWDDVGNRNADPSLYFNSSYFQFWQPLPEPLA